MYQTHSFFNFETPPNEVSDIDSSPHDASDLQKKCDIISVNRTVHTPNYETKWSVGKQNAWAHVSEIQLFFKVPDWSKAKMKEVKLQQKWKNSPR